MTAGREPVDLDLERLARMAEAENWLHRCRQYQRRARRHRVLALVLALVGAVVYWLL